MRYWVLTLLVVLGVWYATGLMGRLTFNLNGGIDGADGGRPIPNGINALTQKDYYAQVQAWMLRNTVTAFRHDIGSSEQGNACADFLGKVCRAVAYPLEPQAYRALAAEGEKLVNGGCSDPLVRLWYGQMLFRSKEYARAEPYLMIAYDWGDNKYPDIHAFFAFRSLAMIAQRKRARRSTEAKDHMGSALNAFCFSLINKEFSDSEAPIAFRLLDETCGDCWDIPKYAFVLHGLEKQEAVSKWLLGMMRGENEIEQAWKARGDGWARDVTEKGWKLFHEHLDRAGTILTKAWHQAPDRPEAAGAMITVAMGGHGGPGETERTWFDRAVSAQMDYPAAYRKMVIALLPRWGGSHEELRAFGRECLATNRFDTDVPLVYLYVLRNIGSELENNRWRGAFRGPNESAALQELFSHSLTEPGRSEARSRILTQQALATAWSGDYGHAQRLLESVGHDVDLDEGFWGKALSWSGRSRAVIDAELRVFTGPQRDLMQQAERLELEGQISEALDLYRQVLKASGGDPGIVGYLRDRMARLMLGKTAENCADPPLVLAARDNELDVAAFLLDEGADANMEDYYYWTALHRAAANGHLQMAKLLLQAGAGLEKRSAFLYTPLHLAIKNKHPDLARFLMESGADVNAAGSSGWMALHLALYYEQPDLAITCIEKGGNILAASEGCWTPLHHAAGKGYTDVASLLIGKGAQLDSRTQCGWTPLQLAVWGGHGPTVRLLIEQGADVSATLPNGRTALMLARERNLPAIEKLLQQSYD